MGIFKKIRHGVAVMACIGAMSVGLATAAQASPAPSRMAAHATTNRTVAVRAAMPTRLTPNGSGSGGRWVYPSVGPCGAVGAYVSYTPYSISIKGNVADYCGSGSYVQVFMVYYSPFYHNQLVGTTGPSPRSGFSWSSGAYLPGHIVVTACEHYNGWHCGGGWGV